MICNDAGVLSYGTAAVRMPVGKYVSPAPNRHEWLIRRENVKNAYGSVWLGNFFIRIVRLIRRDAGFG